ncbi:hypothetical protein [Gloeocapsa sp. PCC 73106]|uniref:hypothetical protein n=1 Tax=Gloeocapsa sp. PCC 73106 TaxID=102232 RepID=UPI0002ACA73D|nr:hypothetical protein [Gloeocapsa sp. PCC 73106]ELR96880.1 hypothetical protein GLO73106DRAFT_00006790 [Gloeocapsa sp. PCC 73106]
MIKAIKRRGVVSKEGKIEINSPELAEGTKVEIIILVDSPEEDATDYLLSTEANRQQLFDAIARVEKRENLVVINSKEWYEKYSL